MVASFRQLVPRPPAAERVGPPEWAGTHVGWAQVAELSDQLPVEPDGAADSAVLVPVYERNDEPVVVLIRRSDLLVRDPGHVAFPGGRIEPGESAVQAALREAEEEVDLRPSAVASTRSLGVYVRRDRRVAAFLAMLDRRPRLRPDPGEVETLIEVPLGRLVADGVAWEERWGGRPMYFFAFEPEPGAPRDELDSELAGDLVWGLTAWILWELVTRLAVPVPPAR